VRIQVFAFGSIDTLVQIGPFSANHFIHYSQSSDKVINENSLCLQRPPDITPYNVPWLPLPTSLEFTIHRKSSDTYDVLGMYVIH